MVLHPSLTHGCLCVCAHRCIFIPTYVRTHALFQHPHDSLEPAKPDRSSVVCALCLLLATLLSRWMRVAKHICEFCCLPEYKYTARRTETAKNIFSFVRATVEREFASLKSICLSVYPAGPSCQFGINSYLSGDERKIILRLVG